MKWIVFASSEGGMDIVYGTKSGRPFASFEAADRAAKKLREGNDELNAWPEPISRLDLEEAE